MLTIRPEGPFDVPAIHAVHLAAFGTDVEARLVEALRAAGRLSISLVADAGGAVVGHVAFSPVTVGATAGGLGLAPVAVLPGVQGRGIGSRLVEEGLKHARSSGVPFLVLLGEPGFYARFGFRAASAHGLADEYGGGAAFQVMDLTEGGIPPEGGLVRYAPECALFA
jgi:putative acetyltransferase